MKAHLVHRWDRNSVQVWIYQTSTFDGLRLFQYGGDVPWVDCSEGKTRLDYPPPSLELPRDVFEALVAEGAGVLPPDRAQDRHLTDAIKVRDRLLKLIEGGAG